MIILGGLVATVSMFFTIGTSFYGMPNPSPAFARGLIDTTSFICVIGTVMGGVLMAYGSELSTTFKTDPTRTESITAVGVYKLAIRVSIGSGFIGTLIGWIAMLGNMSSRGLNRAVLTGGAATSLITILYGLVFSFCLFLPLQYYFQSELDKDS